LVYLYSNIKTMHGPITLGRTLAVLLFVTCPVICNTEKPTFHEVCIPPRF